MLHSSKISIESGLEFARPFNFFHSGVTSCSINSMHSSSIISSSHNEKRIKFTSTSLSNKNPLSMIQKEQNTPSRSLRLVVHGSSGGYVHPLVYYVIKKVEHLRGSCVDLEVLTQEKPKHSSSSSILLVPLLLLPGKHVQNDIPKIYKRLNNEGVNTKLLPFLGCWQQWISILKYLIEMESGFGKPILLHHPLNNDIGSSYLEKLRMKLKIPIVPWTKWSELREKEHTTYTPIPFSLTPNQNTKKLRKHDSISSLLEIDIFLIGLINILTHLT